MSSVPVKFQLWLALDKARGEEPAILFEVKGDENGRLLKQRKDFQAVFPEVIKYAPERVVFIDRDGALIDQDALWSTVLMGHVNGEHEPFLVRRLRGDPVQPPHDATPLLSQVSFRSASEHSDSTDENDIDNKEEEKGAVGQHGLLTCYDSYEDLFPSPEEEQGIEDEEDDQFDPYFALSGAVGTAFGASTSYDDRSNPFPSSSEHSDSTENEYEEEHKLV